MVSIQHKNTMAFTDSIADLATLCDNVVEVTHRECVSRVVTFVTKRSQYTCDQFLSDVQKRFLKNTDVGEVLWQRFVEHWKSITVEARTELMTKALDGCSTNYDDEDEEWSISEEQVDDDSTAEEWDEMTDWVVCQYDDSVREWANDFEKTLLTQSDKANIQIAELQQELKASEASLARLRKTLEDKCEAIRAETLQKIAELKAQTTN